MFLQMRAIICTLVVLIICVSGCGGKKSNGSLFPSSSEADNQIDEKDQQYEENTDVPVSGDSQIDDTGTVLDTDADAGLYEQDDANERVNAEEQEMEPSSGEDIYQTFIDKYAEKSPSALFASGSVFDITRIYHEEFEEAVRSEDALSLLSFFSNAYRLFCDNPEVVGMSSAMVNTANNDTDPMVWNADIFPLSDGDMAALCFMPVQDAQVAARVFGIILSDDGDGYYYCLVDADERVSCQVKRNKAVQGIEDIGIVEGRGLELMENFLDCIKNDFYHN